MKKIYVLLAIWTCWSCENKEFENNPSDFIPSLDEMSSIWIHADTIANFPSLRNFRGQAITNRDLTSISWLASAPFSGGYHTGTLKVNGETVLTDNYKWSVYNALRKSQFQGLDIISDTRLAFEANGALWQINFENTTDQEIAIDVDLDVIGFLSRYDTDWQWWYPTPSVRANEKKAYEEDLIKVFLENLHEMKKVRDSIGINPNAPDWPNDNEIMSSNFYEASKSKNSILVNDLNSNAVTSFSFTQEPDEIRVNNAGGSIKWKLTIPANESKTITYVMSFGSDSDKVAKSANVWSENFEASFADIKSQWEQKWEALFTPANSFVSGNFPVLETNEPKVNRVYYMSALTMLYLTHTNFPVMKRVVLTGGPRWGASIMFYWDTTSWRTIGATTDPEMMKENLRGWLTIDINKYYGRDYLGGKGVGNGYVANYWAIFQMLHEYLVVSGDYAFLEEVIEGRTILEHMHFMAYNWQNLSKEGQEGFEGDIYKLADFGDDPWMLLEAVPTYIHVVPSFNAGYVGMMKRLSSMYDKLGNIDMAESVKKDAVDMAQRVLQLYAGDGTWYSMFPNEKKVEIRHSLDFHFIGRYMADDLDAKTKEEMMTFVEEELLTNTWMRAQSLKDPAAENSDRPDHGPLGAYDGWPLNTMEAMYHMGYPEKAMDFYRAIYPITLEGNWAQAHELWGENKENRNSRVRGAERGWHIRDAASGIGFANVMLREFFGFMPQFMEDSPLDKPDLVRSIQGKMHHVAYQGKLYTITSDQKGLSMEEER
ncbi:MAG: hypothetical protein JXR07_19430 [Reichenbachiella sp.]